MASAWGQSWGSSWGKAWGQIAPPQLLGPGPMGGIIVHETGPRASDHHQKRASARLRADIAAAFSLTAYEDEAAALLLLS